LLYASHGFDEEAVRVRYTSETQLVDTLREGDSSDSNTIGGVLEWRQYEAARNNVNNSITSEELAADAMGGDKRTVHNAGLEGCYDAGEQAS